MSDRGSASATRAVGAAGVGNVLEWYDFAVYGCLTGSIGYAFLPRGADPRGVHR